MKKTVPVLKASFKSYGLQYPNDKWPKKSEMINDWFNLNDDFRLPVPPAGVDECSVEIPSGRDILGLKAAPLPRGIDANHIIYDTLHALLRIGGKLVKLLIIKHLDDKSDRDRLESLMDEIGVCFAFHIAKADTGSGHLGWTKLNGIQMHNVLLNLNLEDLIGAEKAMPVSTLWRTCVGLHDRVKGSMGSPAPTSELLTTLQEDLKKWLDMFIGEAEAKLTCDGAFSVSGAMYALGDITPYIHAFVNHSVALIRENGYLGQYSCQALELMNKLHRQFYQRAVGFGGRAATKRKKLNKKPESMSHAVMRGTLRAARQKAEFKARKKQRTVHRCRFVDVCAYETTYAKCLQTHEQKEHAGEVPVINIDDDSDHQAGHSDGGVEGGDSSDVKDGDAEDGEDTGTGATEGDVDVDDDVDGKGGQSDDAAQSSDEDEGGDSDEKNMSRNTSMCRPSH